jgi:hypothetical protein
VEPRRQVPDKVQGVASTDLIPHRVHAGEALEQRLPIGPRRLRRQERTYTSPWHLCCWIVTARISICHRVAFTSSIYAA